MTNRKQWALAAVLSVAAASASAAAELSSWITLCRNGTAEQEEVLFEGRAKIIKQGNNVFYNEAQVGGHRCVAAYAASWLRIAAAGISGCVANSHHHIW